MSIARRTTVVKTLETLRVEENNIDRAMITTASVRTYLFQQSILFHDNTNRAIRLKPYLYLFYRHCRSSPRRPRARDDSATFTPYNIFRRLSLTFDATESDSSQKYRFAARKKTNRIKHNTHMHAIYVLRDAPTSGSPAAPFSPWYNPRVCPASVCETIRYVLRTRTDDDGLGRAAGFSRKKKKNRRPDPNGVEW